MTRSILPYGYAYFVDKHTVIFLPKKEVKVWNDRRQIRGNISGIPRIKPQPYDSSLPLHLNEELKFSFSFTGKHLTNIIWRGIDSPIMIDASIRPLRP